MTTSCVVARKTPDGYEAFHRFWDGYPEKPGGMGWEIKKEYSKPREVDRLFFREEPYNHSKPRDISNKGLLMDYAQMSGSQYLYLYENGKWKYWDLYQPNGWKEL